MADYIVTVFNGDKEIPLIGLKAGERANLADYNCRHIYPQDWLVFSRLITPKAFNTDIIYFLEKGYEIRLYRKKTS